METIKGLTNWRLTVRREAEAVTILRAVTCDREAALPDTLFGLPVTALADHALAAGASPLAGEEIRVLGGAESEDWDNRNITALTLPRPLERFGDYAFMNLGRMETLRFSDRLRELGSAAFMNCRCFSRLELSREGLRQGPALASIVRNLPHELDVTVYRPEGDTLRLIFPEYIESYTENTPAHHFELKIIGGGYAYHGVFRDKVLSVSDYDSLWRDYIAQEHDDLSALRLAYYRLRYPSGLSERAREQYGAFLRQNLRDALFFALRERDGQGLALLLALGAAEDGALDAALEEARRLRLTEATALLLEKRRERPAAGKMKKFEL